MTQCEVVGCQNEAKRSGMCAPHCFVWLLTRGSDRTPGREDRLRAFIARSSARNFYGPVPIIREEGSP